MMRGRSLEGISSIVSEAFTIHRDAHAPAFSPRLKDRLMDSPSGIEGFEPAEVIPLTRAMAAGNEEAYRRFHRLYAWRLFRLGATLLGGDLDAAADLVQETMVRVVRGIRRFDTELAFWNWLAAILRNLSIDHRRLRERQRKLWESRGSLPFESSREAPEELDLLESALSQLDDSAAQLLRLKYHEGLPVRRIAEREGLGIEAVESRLARARTKLREIMLCRMGESHE